MKRYGVLIADPPWSYAVERRNGASNHYPTMSTADICALPVADLAADDAVLLLWATWPQLADAFRVIAAWGFEQVSGFPWIKCARDPQRTLWGEREYRPQWGTGFWVRGCSELVLICRRGHVSLPGGEHIGLLSVNFQHSRKPASLYEYAESLPGPYLELFARRCQGKWDVWGNEVASTVALHAGGAA